MEDTACPVRIRKLCLDTPVILRQLLEKFSSRELLKLSLVNKQWNFEARSVMRGRGNVMAAIHSDSFNSCQKIVALATDLKKMRVVPTSGIRLLLCHPHLDACQSWRPESQDPSYKTILERLPCKSLAVTFEYNWEKFKNCQAVLLVTEMLLDYAGVLEDLLLDFGWTHVEPFRRALHCRNNFPRLKILQVGHYGSGGDCLMNFVKMLVSCAPVLKELRILGKVNFHENVLEGSLAVLVPYLHFNPLYETVCESLLPALRPKTVEFCQIWNRNFNVELLSRNIPMVLQASLTTLNSMLMDLLFAVPLMCYGICLENVTELSIRVDGRFMESFEPRLLTLLKAFHFNRVFPKLTQVEIQGDYAGSQPFSPDVVGSFVEQAVNVAARETSQDRASNIKKLLLCSSILSSMVPFLAQMFPQVHVLSVFLKGSSGDLFTVLWDHFHGMKELVVTYTGGPLLGMDNLDCVFCGIFSEEVARLREMDDEYLKAVNIVPVMPSLACMRDLRKFTLLFTPEHFLLAGRDPSFMFSKVTGLIGFARCSHQEVTFLTSSGQCAEALDHLRPYASFVYLEDLGSE